MTWSDVVTSPGLAIAGLWAAFAASWLVASRWAEKTEKTPGLTSELPYRVILFAGAVLFVIRAHGYEGSLRLWHVDLAEAWACAGLIAAGFAFAWWARVHLGRLWSGNVTRKAGHRLIETGPYALVRHPIYTGLLAAVVATMIAKGTLLGIGGAALIIVGVYLKARLEERFLRAELGEADYDAYRRRVPMLVPFT
jgi:protein-S-isoprenylcysteine O-methyltransferase Ste14